MQLHPAEQLALDAARARDRSLVAQPARRRAHGIVHTPPELARFVLRAVDDVLREQLALAAGLADPRVHVLDPACGPGAFLAATLQRLAHEPGGGAGVTLSGIDLDAAALQLSAALVPQAASLGAQLQLCCADTLRELPPAASVAPGRLLAIVGNPPWTVAAAEATPEMQQLLETFRCDADGVRLPEKKLGVLSDAYVRFVRWAAEAARLCESGAVVALVTNASFLDGPVHRGMRAALLRWFDALWVVDLGGNALLPSARDRSAPDDNVFGVRTGVAISVLYRQAGLHEPRCGVLRYCRLRGTRADKLEQLSRASLRELAWTEHAPQLEAARFVPTRARPPLYEGWPSLAQCLPFHREGVQSNRDAMVVDSDRARLLARLRAFAQGRDALQLPSALTSLPHYDPQRARSALARALERDPEGRLGIVVRRLAYRPFDTRWFCPIAPLCHRPRPELLAAVDASALSLVTVRKDRGSAPYAHFGVAEHVIDNCYLSTRSSCRSRAFPTHTASGAPNLSPQLAVQLAELSDGPADPRELVCYALCVLSSATYRTRFEAELRLDYPRIPWPPPARSWLPLLAAGARLAQLLGAESAEPLLLTEALERAEQLVVEHLLAG